MRERSTTKRDLIVSKITKYLLVPECLTFKHRQIWICHKAHSYVQETMDRKLIHGKFNNEEGTI